MYYNDPKGKGYGKGFAYNKSKNSSQFPSLSEKENEDCTKEELNKMKKAINDMRYRMYEISGFDEEESIIITDETVRISQELDVLITEYYLKKKI